MNNSVCDEHAKHFAFTKVDPIAKQQQQDFAPVCSVDASHTAARQFCCTCHVIVCAECVIKDHKSHEQVQVQEMKQYWSEKLHHVVKYIGSNKDKVNKAAGMVNECKKQMQKVLVQHVVIFVRAMHPH